MRLNKGLLGLLILTGIILSGYDDETPASSVSNKVNINGDNTSIADKDESAFCICNNFILC